MQLNEKQLEKITGAIITSFVNLHFLEEIKLSRLVKHKVKNNLNKTLNDLIQIERKYFDEIESIDDDNLSDKLVANKLEFVKWLLNNYSYNDFTKLQEVCLAYTTDRKKVTDITDSILKDSGAEVIN
jgi:Rad3-related DNA helicase